MYNSKIKSNGTGTPAGVNCADCDVACIGFCQGGCEGYCSRCGGNCDTSCVINAISSTPAAEKAEK